MNRVIANRIILRSQNLRVNENMDTIRQLVLRGSHAEALDQVEELLKTRISPDKQLDCLLLKGIIFNKLGELDKGLKQADLAFDRSSSDKRDSRAVEAIIIKIESLWRLGKLDEGISLIEEGKERLNGLENRYTSDLEGKEGSLLRHEGIIYLYKGDLVKATQLLQQALMIFEQINDDENIAATLNNLGSVQKKKGDLEEAIDSHQKSLKIRKQIGNKQAIAASLNNIGNALLDKGDTNGALDNYLKSLRILEDLGNSFMISYLLNNAGVLYHDRGELDKALEFLERSLKIRKEIGNEQIIARSLNNVGSVYRDMEKYDRALKMHEQALVINVGIGNNLETADTLFDLANAALDKGDNDLAEKYCKQLQAISSAEDHWVIHQKCDIIKALLLKTEKRIRERFKATEMLEEIIERGLAKGAYHDLTAIAMINLCDLLLYEAKTLGEKSVLGEVQDLTTKIHDIAKNQASHSLLVESYLLNSRLALLELDTEKAQEFLSLARLTAIERGLDRLARTIEAEEEILLSNINKWKEMFARKPRMQEIIELTQIDDLVNRIIHKKVQRDEKEIQDYAAEVHKLWSKMEEKEKNKVSTKVQ